MADYKVRVKSKEEAYKVKELFGSLGLRKGAYFGSEEWVVTDNDCSTGATSLYSELSKIKELTLPQLKDLVVLKRNDVADATHTDQDNWKWYVGADAYVWQAGNAQQLKQWDKASLDMVDLKPIAKETIMKEYLVNYNGKYKLEHLHNPIHGAIEIPEGAEYLTECMDNEELFKLWWKGMHKLCIGYDKDLFYMGERVNDYLSRTEHLGSKIVWRRHTQPEELPFLDNGDDDKSDCDSKLGNFVVDDTLNQRQSQYGDFHDVAHTTQYLLQMLSNDKMSDVQLESLHMICSKLARIAHGDPNHIDSWHDIAGYATLVVKDIS